MHVDHVSHEHYDHRRRRLPIQLKREGQLQPDRRCRLRRNHLLAGFRLVLPCWGDDRQLHIGGRTHLFVYGDCVQLVPAR